MTSQTCIELTRSEFIERCIYVKGAKYSFKERQYLLPIVDYPAKELVLKAGRQTEKSTIIAATTIADMCMIPFFKVLYVSLSGKQVSDFSNDKLHNMLTFSPFIYKHYYSSDKVDLIKRITDKSLTNGSHISLRSAYRTAETIRGISADKVIIDEVQSILTDNIQVIKECASRSNYKWFIYAGTGKTSDNPIEYFWNRSNQYEWLIKCTFCGHYNYQDEKILKPHMLVCLKCNSMLNVNNGQWVKVNSNNYESRFGFRITQYMLSNVDYRDLWEKLNSYSLARFYNEVLGLPFDFAAKPVSILDLQQLCNSVLHNEITKLSSDTLNIAGIDWGTGFNAYTVITIGAWDGNKFKITYAHRFSGRDPVNEIDEIERMVLLSNVNVVMADWGFGYLNNELLAKRLAPHNVVVAPVYYIEGTSEEPSWDGFKYKVNRTKTLSELFNAIKKHKIEFFNWAEFETFASDILNIFIDYRDSRTKSVIFYNHAVDKPDDYAHALNLAFIGAKLFSGRLLIL